MNGVAELEVALPPRLTEELAVGRRRIDGLYLAARLGRLSKEGSLLDTRAGDFAIASAWRDPACEILQCFRARVTLMVPHEYRRCAKHGLRTLTREDLDAYPLEGEEFDLAEREAWRERAPRLGILPIDRGRSFTSCESTLALEAARAVAEPNSDYCERGVILEGNSGSGKSTAIACAVRASAIAEARVGGGIDHICFYTFPALIRRLLNPATRDETLETCCETPELYLDDLGASHVRADSFVTNLVEEIVITREGARSPMLASTNLEPRRFRALFGDRVFDRIRGEWGAWFNVDAPSLRRKAGR